jgi:GldM C-terminal domain
MKYQIFNRRQTVYQLFFIATALLALSMIAIGQTNVAVAPVKMNVLYIGIDNPVSVAASGGTDDKVTVSITGGGSTVSKIDAGLYNIKVTQATDDCTVNVYVDGKLAGTSKFRVRRIPSAFASVAGYRSGAAVRADFFSLHPGLSVYIENLPLELKYEVTSFKVVLLDDKRKIKSVDCQGNLFSDEVRQYLKYLTPGDIVTIEKIFVKGPDGKEYQVPSLLYNIVE